MNIVESRDALRCCCHSHLYRHEQFVCRHVLRCCERNDIALAIVQLLRDGLCVELLKLASCVTGVEINLPATLSLHRIEAYGGELLSLVCTKCYCIKSNGCLVAEVSVRQTKGLKLRIVWSEVGELSEVGSRVVPLQENRIVAVLLRKDACWLRDFLCLHNNGSRLTLCRLYVAVHCRNLILVLADRHTCIYKSFCRNNVAAYFVAVTIHLIASNTCSCNVRLPCNLHRVETRHLLCLHAYWRHSREHRTAELHNHRLRRNSVVAVRILVIVVYRHRCGACHVVKGFAVRILRRVWIDENMIVGEVHTFLLQILVCECAFSVLVYITQIVVLTHYSAMVANVKEVEVILSTCRKYCRLPARLHVVDCPCSVYLVCSACLFVGLPTAEVKQFFAIGRELLAHAERRLLVGECCEVAVWSPETSLAVLVHNPSGHVLSVRRYSVRHCYFLVLLQLAEYLAVLPHITRVVAAYSYVAGDIMSVGRYASCATAVYCVGRHLKAVPAVVAPIAGELYRRSVFLEAIVGVHTYYDTIVRNAIRL